MTHSDNLAPRAFSASPGAVRSDSGMFLRGFVGSAVLLVAINASEPLFFGEHHFQSLSFHPFWIVILLAAVQHGLFVGLGIVALATLMMDWPSRPIGIDITDHYVNIATTPAQWLIVALLIGIYRQQQIRRERMLEAENSRLTQVNQTLAGEIHRLDAFVARAELAAATQANNWAVPAECPPSPAVAMAADSLPTADAADRTEVAANAAQAGNALHSALPASDEAAEPQAADDDPTCPDLADGVAGLAADESPVPADHHDACQSPTPTSRDKVASLTPRDASQAMAPLAPQGRQPEKRIVVQPEPAHAHA